MEARRRRDPCAHPIQGMGSGGGHSRLGSNAQNRHILAMAKPKTLSKPKAGAGPREKQPREPAATQPDAPKTKPVEEIGGRDGPDPTRYGDYEKNGRCVDF